MHDPYPTGRSNVEATLGTWSGTTHRSIYTRFILLVRSSDVSHFRFTSVITLLVLRKSRREPKRVNGNLVYPRLRNLLRRTKSRS